MNRFEKLTPEQVADIINNRTKTTLLVSKELTQTGSYPNGYVPMGMPYISESIIKEVLAHSSMSGNSVTTRWTTFIIFTSYFGGSIKYINLDDDDCEITVEFRTEELPPIKFT